MPELFILDVGHGNCSLLRDAAGVVLIDCPQGNVLQETLNNLGITEIAHVLISHADQDHIAGVPQLLLNEKIKVHNIHLNSDWLRNTAIWQDVLVALRDARQRSGVTIEAQLTTSTTKQLAMDQVTIEVLAPSPELALAGVGGHDLAGKRLTANSLSAVISLSNGARRIAMLTGDLDQTGFNNLLEEGKDLQAEVLIFPHHGGRAGAGVDSKAFAQQLCSLVQPKLVIFSIDRTLHRNPDEAIMAGVLSAVPETHILCTQLSEKCAIGLPQAAPIHLSELPAKGRSKHQCCGGSIIIQMDTDGKNYQPLVEEHRSFVTQFPDRLCQLSVNSVS